MERIPAIALVACLLLTASAWFATRPPGAVPAGEDRLKLLAAEVAALRAERQALQERLAQLEGAIVAVASAQPAPSSSPGEVMEVERAAAEDVGEPREQAAAVPANLRRIEDAGLTDEEYASMQQQAQAFYLENFEQEWQARREAFLGSPPVPDSSDRLRSELGDDAYDRYLYASGRPNRVRVRRVMPGSAAAAAGISEGDILLSYDGERLFRFNDLRAASYRGEPGASVLMEVRREDGTVAQMVITRGPMGISGYGGWRETPGS